MRYEFARDRLRAAVLILALENGSLQERLVLSCIRELQRIVDADMPLELRQRLAAVQLAMSAEDAVLLARDDGWARRLATEIVELYAAVAQAVG